MFNLKFGVEIEGISSMTRSELAAKLRRETNTDVYERGYDHVTRDYWRIVHDGSIEDFDPSFERGFELVSPPLEGQEGLDQIRAMCDALSQVARVNYSCGLHVHLDAAGKNLDWFKSFVKAFIANEKTFDSLMPEERQDNNAFYCRSLIWADKNIIDRCLDLEEISDYLQDGIYRYFKLNLLSYWRHQTVEIRHHFGTVDGEAIVNWVQLLGNLYHNHSQMQEEVSLSVLCGVADRLEVSGKIKELKSQVYSALGLTDTKSVKKWAKSQGIEIDLRCKSSWAFLLSKVQSSPVANKLEQYYDLRATSIHEQNLVSGGIGLTARVSLPW